MDTVALILLLATLAGLTFTMDVLRPTMRRR